MNYEIDFIGVSKEKVNGNADAICFRIEQPNGLFKYFVYDCGHEALADEMTKIMRQYYFNNGKPSIDALIVSHSDEDHASGVTYLLDKINVKTIYINVPWYYVDKLLVKIGDGRLTKDSLIRKLKERYKYVNDIVEKAITKGIEIKPLFQGNVVENQLQILSPSYKFYECQLVESYKKKYQNQSEESILNVKGDETIDDYENNVTPENETSVVLASNVSDENEFILTGDAGEKAFWQVIDYCNEQGINLKGQVKCLQIAHHGSRHNYGSDILDEIIGEKTSGKLAVASVAEKDYPRQEVIDAFKLRNVRVYRTYGTTLNYQNGLPDRIGWGPATSL